MTSIKISNEAYTIFLEYARRNKLSFDAAMDEIAKTLVFEATVDARSVSPAPISLSRQHLAELFFLEAQKETDLNLFLESVTGDENEQYVVLTISAAYETHSAMTVEVILRYGEMDAAPTPYAGGKLVLSRLEEAFNNLSVHVEEASDETAAETSGDTVKRGRGRPRRSP
jgi:hypothetical protein